MSVWIHYKPTKSLDLFRFDKRLGPKDQPSDSVRELNNVSEEIEFNYFAKYYYSQTNIALKVKLVIQSQGS